MTGSVTASPDDAHPAVTAPWLLALAVAIGATALASGCTGSKGGGDTKTASKRTGVLRYYPLEPGMQWSFMLRESPAAPGLLVVTKVVAFDGTNAELRTGTSTTALRVAKDGIVREPQHTYMLRWPIELGQKWPTSPGATMEVTGVDQKVTVEAGTFEGCVETTERFGGDEARVLRTVFCPDVGPVTLEATALGVEGGAVTQRATLRAFGPGQVLAPPTSK